MAYGAGMSRLEEIVRTIHAVVIRSNYKVGYTLHYGSYIEYLVKELNKVRPLPFKIAGGAVFSFAKALTYYAHKRIRAQESAGENYQRQEGLCPNGG